MKIANTLFATLLLAGSLVSMPYVDSLASTTQEEEMEKS